MIFLFSQRDGPLRRGAEFMEQKNAGLHPGDHTFYLVAQPEPHHECVGNLGPDSEFGNLDCRLGPGEVAIVIAHGGDDQVYDEDGRPVTDAALRLLARIAEVNADGHYGVFLAACGGAVRQPGQPTSLLTSLVRRTPALAEQLLQDTVFCWGYTASAGLVDIEHGLPGDRAGTHIFGVLADARRVEQHCGYDCRVTTRLRRLRDGRYLTIYFSPALYPLEEVVAWADGGYEPAMAIRFPGLYPTVELTSRDTVEG